MPPDSLPPDDEREPDSRDANVVDPDVLAERRAQRAEHAERSATRRAADAQSLAADLARERARLEAERDAARAEAAAAREGADAVKAEALHLQAERDALRVEVERGAAEREALRLELDQARVERVAPPQVTPSPVRVPNGNGAPVPASWGAGLRRELAVARAAAASPSLPPAAAAVVASSTGALGRERDLVARRVAEGIKPGALRTPPRRATAPAVASEPVRPGERSTPFTAIALERERSNRLRAELERAAAVERELRTQLAALERAVHERREAEQRIESALRRVRNEFDAARELAAASPAPSSDQLAAASTAPSDTAASAPVASSSPGTDPASVVASAAGTATPALPAMPAALAAEASVPATALDAERLDAAQARLRAASEPEGAAEPRTTTQSEPPSGPPAPWLPAALRRLVRDDPRMVGRLVTAMLPAQGLVTQRALHFDLVLDGRGCVGVDVGNEGTLVRQQAEPRPRRDVDFRLTTDEEGLARLLLARRGRRRGVRVRGSRRRVRELRRLVHDPLALRDLASAGAMLDPVLALSLAGLAVDPSATYGHRFTIAHAPLAGGPADAWLRIQNGAPLVALGTRPGERPVLTIRSTRGALLPLLAGIEPPRGEAAALDGDAEALAIVRAWIARTEFPAA